MVSLANHGNVHLVKDRIYYDWSTMISARTVHASKVALSIVHDSNTNTPIPPRDAVLKWVADKIQINNIEWEKMMNVNEFLTSVISEKRLFMSGVEAVPAVVEQGRNKTWNINYPQVMRRPET